MSHLFRRLCRDENGVVSITGAFVILIALALSVMVIDVGHLYLTKRRLQSAVDAAALAASANPTEASRIAQAALAQNGYPATGLTVVAGHYSADSSLAVAARFNADPALTHNAVRVTQTISTPGFFTTVLSLPAFSDVQATATAARLPSVSFSAGSGLADLSEGDLNEMLGALLGTELMLSLADYTKLVGTNIDALEFLDALASNVGLDAGTYGDLADADITLGQMLVAGQAVLNAHPSPENEAAASVLNSLSLAAPSEVTATLGSLIDFSLWDKREIGSIVSSGDGAAALNLFDMLAATARVYGSGHIVDVGNAVTIPGVGASVTTQISLGQQLQSVAFGHVGDRINTAQVEMALKVTAAKLNLGVAKVDIALPLYVRMASGHATVAAIPCEVGGPQAQIALVPKAAFVAIGTMDDYNDDVSEPVETKIASVSLNLLPSLPIEVKGSAAIPVADSSEEFPKEFSADDIANGTVKSAYASDGPLFSNLADDLSLHANVLGNAGLLGSTVNGLLNGTVVPLLANTLGDILAGLDPIVENLLKTIGLKLGTLDVVVHGVGCGRPMLVG